MAGKSHFLTVTVVSHTYHSKVAWLILSCDVLEETARVGGILALLLLMGANPAWLFHTASSSGVNSSGQWAEHNPVCRFLRCWWHVH